MKITKLSVLLMCALSGLAAPALAVFENEAQIGTAGRANAILRDANFNVIGRPEDSFSHMPLPHVDPKGVEVFLTTSQSANAGSGSALAILHAVGEAGRIGAGITLGAAGDDFPEPPGFPTLIDASGAVTLAFARASWKETLRVPPVPGVPMGTPIRAHGLLYLDVEGEFGITASGRLSGGHAAVQLKDVDGAEQSIPDAPYSTSQCGVANCWGYLEKNLNAYTAPPTNVDIFLEPPTGEAGGAIKVDIIGNVGSLITAGYEITVSGTVGSGDGAVAIRADFSHTLKWGGIEAIFNRNTGELIEGLTIESESGFDYMRSYDAQVPEPSSIALVIAASCFLLRRTRARA
jgi:hypothetical protein